MERFINNDDHNTFMRDRLTLDNWFAERNLDAIRWVRNERPVWLDTAVVNITPLDVPETATKEVHDALVELLDRLGYDLPVTVVEEPETAALMQEHGVQGGATWYPALLAHVNPELNANPLFNKHSLPLAHYATDSPRIFLTPQSRVRLGYRSTTGKPLEYKATSRSKEGMIVIPIGNIPGFDGKNRVLTFHEGGHLFGFNAPHHDTYRKMVQKGNILLPVDQPYEVIDELSRSDRNLPCAMQQSLSIESDGYCPRCEKAMQNARLNVYGLRRELGRNF